MSITTPLNNRFQESYNQYKARIEKVTDVTQRNSLLELLTGIANGILYIEKAHENALFGDRQSLSDVSDKRSAVTNLRKQLEQRLTALKV
jgi:hypothetical protein